MSVGRVDGTPARTDPARPQNPSPVLPAPLGLVGFELSLDTASLDALDRVSRFLDRSRLQAWFDDADGTEEVAIVTTCHRVELLPANRDPTVAGRWGERLPGDPAGWRERTGRDVVRHLFEVAAGLRSLAVGEREVRAQVRAAATGTISRHPRPVVRELLDAAVDAADELEPSVPSSRSIAAVASRVVLDRVGRPFPRVVVVGSGTVGRQLAELLAPTARVTLTYHHRPPDDAFLRSTGARVVPTSRLAEEVGLADAVVAAAKSGSRCLGPTELVPGRPLVLVDLGVPRNIDPAVRGTPGVELFDLEDLRRRVGRTEAASGDDPRRAEQVDRFWNRFERLALEPWIDALRRATEALRRAELERARPFLGSLSAEQEVAVERLTHRLVAQLLLPPTERMRALPAGPEGARLRRFAVELLRPSPPEP